MEHGDAGPHDGESLAELALVPHVGDEGAGAVPLEAAADGLAQATAALTSCGGLMGDGAGGSYGGGAGAAPIGALPPAASSAAAAVAAQLPFLVGAQAGGGFALNAFTGAAAAPQAPWYSSMHAGAAAIPPQPPVASRHAGALVRVARRSHGTCGGCPPARGVRLSRWGVAGCQFTFCRLGRPPPRPACAAAARRAAARSGRPAAK